MAIMWCPTTVPHYTFVFRFNRRRAKSPAHGFARALQHAVRIPPATHRTIAAAHAS